MNASSSSLASTSNSTLPPLPLEPFLSSLQAYKTLQKSLQKDASQAGKIKNELGRVWRDLERWGIENGVTTASSSIGGGKKPRKGLNPNGVAKLTAMRTRERAMETVAGVLVDELGWLVPLAKKYVLHPSAVSAEVARTYRECIIARKRPSTRSPSLPQALVDLYTPLLEFLDETLFSLPSSSNTTDDDSDDSDTDSFIDTLVSRIVDLLCGATSAGKDVEEKSDPTVHATLQAWLLHLVPLPTTSEGQGEVVDTEAVESIEGIIKTCLIAGTPSYVLLLNPASSAWLTILHTLVDLSLSSKHS